jgi:hypothetical protein
MIISKLNVFPLSLPPQKQFKLLFRTINPVVNNKLQSKLLSLQEPIMTNETTDVDNCALLVWRTKPQYYNEGNVSGAELEVDLCKMN